MSPSLRTYALSFGHFGGFWCLEKWGSRPVVPPLGRIIRLPYSIEELTEMQREENRRQRKLLDQMAGMLEANIR